MRRIGFLLFEGFPMSCLTSVIEPLRAANEISGQEAFRWQLFSETGEKVMSSAGLTFEPQGVFDRNMKLDTLILLSTPSSTFGNTQTAAHLRWAARHGAVLGAISGGVFPLTRSGAVSGETLSVHWCYETAYAAEFPDAAQSNRVIEVSPHCVSASGAAAAFDLALSFIGDELDAEIATEAACWFQHPLLRQSSVRQAVPAAGTKGVNASLPPLVGRAVEVFSHNMTHTIRVGDVAAQLRTSPRHLERSFKKATGLSPSRYFRHMRMKAARQIVMYSNNHLTSIAASVGYASTTAFKKHYEATFGLSPMEDRERIMLYRL